MTDKALSANKALLAKTPRKLFRQIFDAENPKQFVRAIPSQMLYLSIRDQGLPSSSEVLELLSIEQLRLVLDFDLWTGDRLEEDSLWEWLELPDQTNDLTLLQRMLQSIDLKLVALVLHRYVDVIIHEEPTDAHPGEGFHSPDKGYTWVRVSHENSNREFSLKRLLALIFETSTELFFQIIQIPNVSTQTVLEESAYQDKSKRLLSEGVPDNDWAAELQSTKTLAEATKALSGEKESRSPIEDILSVPAFAYSHSLPSPLKEFLGQVSDHPELERELTLMMNSALVHFRIPLWDTEQVNFLLNQVRGAANIGLERILSSSPTCSFPVMHDILGLRGIYQVGLESIFALRTRSQKISEEACEDDPRLLHLLDGLSRHFPSLPAFLSEDGTVVEVQEKLKGGFRPIETIADIELSELFLSKLEQVTISEN